MKLWPNRATSSSSSFPNSLCCSRIFRMFEFAYQQLHENICGWIDLKSKTGLSICYFEMKPLAAILRRSIEYSQIPPGPAFSLTIVWMLWMISTRLNNGAAIVKIESSKYNFFSSHIGSPDAIWTTGFKRLVPETKECSIQSLFWDEWPLQSFSLSICCSTPCLSARAQYRVSLLTMLRWQIY